MRKLFLATMLAGCFLCAHSLWAQQLCPGLSYVANTPEDALMQAVNGAESPQEQIAALDKFAQAHPNSKFMPCVQEYYTLAYLKLKDYAKVIEHGEKGLAGNYRDMMLIMNTAKAYVASGKVDDKAFDIIDMAPAQIKVEANPPRPSTATNAEWEKNLKELAAQAKQEKDYMEYAFFQLLPRVTDPAKRITLLNNFLKAYPDSQTQYAKEIDSAYYLAYRQTNQPEKSAEYAEKAIAADPNNAPLLAQVAYDYAVSRRHPEKAGEYAQKALTLVPTMKKPENVSQEQFTKQQQELKGMAHLTLGYVDFLKSARTHRLAPAIRQLKSSISLLEGNPQLQGQALYYLGYAYEELAEHRAAIAALTRASRLESSFKGPAKELLRKIRRAGG